MATVCCRHVGDLGFIQSVNGVANATIYDRMVSLFGNYSVIGRSIVVSILTMHY